LASAGSSLRFIPSPDGRQIALLSTTTLRLVDADGSNQRTDILTYPEAGAPLPVFPTGVWTQDSGAFLLVAPAESGPVLNLVLWGVPVDGSPAQSLATITADTHPASVTFSPAGDQAAYYQWQPEEEGTGWFIIPLSPGLGPLAVPPIIEMGYANLHWSPAGTAFVFPDDLTGNLFQLCPDATQSSEVCGDPVAALSSAVAAIGWIDSNRFLIVTRNDAESTQTLSLGTLDGIVSPIGTWTAIDQMPPDLQLKLLQFDFQ
jgi:hypothetical protein